LNPRLGGPWATQGPPKPNPSRQKVATLYQVPTTNNQVPAFWLIAKCQMPIAKCQMLVFSKIVSLRTHWLHHFALYRILFAFVKGKTVEGRRSSES
jgi:hypothetical protein